MNLKMLFNFNFLYQNLKKSKVLLIFLCCIIPFINIWMIYLNLFKNNYVLDFIEISKITSIIAFIFPLILSYILFGFLLKKNVIDFVISKPISRKKIFFTNVLGGFIIIIFIILLNTLGLYLLSLFTKIFIPFEVLLDYFVYWLITYFFVFLVSSLALCLSHNWSSFILVYLIILLIYPCITLINYNFKYRNEKVLIRCNDSSCMPNEVNLGNNDNEYYYEIKHYYSNNLNSLINYYVYGYKNQSLLKTICLNVIYLILSYYAFKNHKMEYSESSIQNVYAYKLLKFITYLPISFICFMMFMDSISFLMISIIICLGYYFVFDLIMKKEFINPIKTLFEFMVVSVVIFCSYFAINYYYKNNNKIIDIPSEIIIEYYDNILNVSSKVLLNNQDIIKKIIKDNNVSDSQNNVVVYIDNNYYKNYYINNYTFQELKKYINNNKLNEKVTNKNIIFITADSNNYINIPLNDNFLNNVISHIDTYKEDSYTSFYLNVYKYENHSLKKMTINVGKNKDLLNYVKKYVNEDFVTNFNNDNDIFCSNIKIEFLDYINGNKSNFLTFLDNHKYDKIQDYAIIFSSGSCNYIIDSKILLKEYGDYGVFKE